MKYTIRNGDVAIKIRSIDGKKNKIIFKDNTFLDVHNILWARGFESDNSWSDILGVLDEKGKPVHNRGITNIEGLYFLGLPWNIDEVLHSYKVSGMTQNI
ncbi:hypothetical protein [Radiobacillus sp. PE A8.2]|uniref:hypothetical protein n=1 Tax=Radiobacillus sp. PE A8.2 TaxID=3380349 RepID=UPI00388D22E2